MHEKPPSPPSGRALWAYVGPFGLFMALLTLGSAMKSAQPGAPLWLAAPEFWIYPLQTVLCAGLLIYFRREHPRAATAGGLALGAAAGLAVFALWVTPQEVFHAARRVEGGFDPRRLLAPSEPHTVYLYGASLVLRFVRLAAVVPILEEVFWRGFVLRYLVKEDFTAVPFGTFTPLSFGAVALGFMLEHSVADYPAALLAGVIYNYVAVRTKSLPACILAHALTNLLLGLYVMHTGQWGFW